MSAAPLGGTEMLDECWLQATSLDHVVSDGAWASENRHETCCAPDIIVPGQPSAFEV